MLLDPTLVEETSGNIQQVPRAHGTLLKRVLVLMRALKRRHTLD
jgi:hypothetical protein